VKTINLTIDEATWRAARRLAAERDTSVSAMVRQCLRNLTSGLTNEEVQQRRALAQALQACGAEVGEKPSRARTYARR
jgi:plasmid stability protein